MIHVAPTILEDKDHRVRLEPLTTEHAEGLKSAASDGELWKLFFTSVPSPDSVADYIATALDGQSKGHMLPWAVRDLSSGTIVGTTRYHDIVPEVDRVEIGYTWYAASCHRSHVNTTCKLMLLRHAFDHVGCAVVGWRTDNFNHRSQRAIEALGAKKDGAIRHHGLRRDGSVRDTVFYSVLQTEWSTVRKHLETRLWRNSKEGGHSE